VCYVCSENGHFIKKCRNCKGKKIRQGQESANVTIGDPSRGSRYGNLPTVFFVCQSNEW